jgi:hypothetical protein
MQWLNLPLFVPTFLAIVFRPGHFFRVYHEICTTRQSSFWSLNAENEGDPYLAPVKFAALTVAISTLLVPLTYALGPRAGAMSPQQVEFANEFAKWAEAKGYLTLAFIGVGFIDKFLRDVLALLVFYGLGYAIALFSAGKIAPRFAAGHFYYWNAWSLLDNLLGAALLVASLAVPLYQTPLPGMVRISMFIVTVFMFLGFPVLVWPRIVGISWQRAAVAVAAGFAIWVAGMAVLAQFILPSYDFSDAPLPPGYSSPGRY